MGREGVIYRIERKTNKEILRNGDNYNKQREKRDYRLIIERKIERVQRDHKWIGC